MALNICLIDRICLKSYTFLIPFPSAPERSERDPVLLFAPTDHSSSAPSPAAVSPSDRDIRTSVKGPQDMNLQNTTYSLAHRVMIIVWPLPWVKGYEWSFLTCALFSCRMRSNSLDTCCLVICMSSLSFFIPDSTLTVSAFCKQTQIQHWLELILRTANQKYPTH